MFYNIFRALQTFKVLNDSIKKILQAFACKEYFLKQLPEYLIRAVNV